MFVSVNTEVCQSRLLRTSLSTYRAVPECVSGKHTKHTFKYIPRLLVFVFCEMFISRVGGNVTDF